MITVWGRANSTNVIKVLWLCEELSLRFDRKDVGGPFGGLQTPEFLALNPNGVIPVIEDGGAVVWESHSILRYLSQRYGSDALYPLEPMVRSHVERWLDWHISTLAPALNPVFVALYRTPPERRDQAAIDVMIERLSAAMLRLDSHLAAQPFIAGASFRSPISRSATPYGAGLRFLSISRGWRTLNDGSRAYPTGPDTEST